LGFSYIDNVLSNISDTNRAVAGKAARVISGASTAGVLAKATTSITPLQFALGGFKGVTMGAANFTALETGITAATLGLLNAVYSGFFFELGVLGGSLVNGIPLSCDSSFKSLGNETVRDVVSGTIEQAIINFKN
jgi:hypothetical protein